MTSASGIAVWNGGMVGRDYGPAGGTVVPPYFPDGGMVGRDYGPAGGTVVPPYGRLSR